jgi:GxxExxY protein
VDADFTSKDLPQMNTDDADFKHTDLTRQIIKAAFNVHGELGFGFVEKVYENALMIELRSLGLAVRQQEPVQVFYQEQLVGDYVADMIVEDKVLVELKAVKTLDPGHEVQLVNYLKATRIEVGLLLNFADSVEITRKVFTASRNQRNLRNLRLEK